MATPQPTPEPAAPEPPPAPPLTLGAAVQYAPGVGPRRAELFERLGVRTVADLIKHLPHRYEYHAGQAPITTLPVGSVATARGTIINCRWVGGGRSSPIGRPGGGGRGRLTASMKDDTGYLDLVWFNAPFMRDKIHPGVELLVTGPIKLYNDGRQMVNPKSQIIHPDDEQNAAELGEERYRPIYPATQALPSGWIERIIEDTLPAALPQVEDHLAPAYRAERNLPELREAYRMLHAPADEDEVKSALRRLAYDELLLLQLAFAVRRKHTQTELAAPPLRYSEAIDRHIRQRFPFELTAAQDAVVREIREDLRQPVPMNRLLQGDVGSGKTVVALYALLLAVAAEKQGALMAPTELLAEQHYLSISRMLTDSTVRLALLTGSLSKPERQAMTYRVERGEVDIVIGTQAMLSESVRFNDLGVVVVDEQHRFGVVQRAAIRSKAGEAAPERNVPHTLVMTATPIPRTMGISVFGDLDISTISKLPPGRQPIITRVVPPAKSDDVYRYIAQRVAGGEQAYIVLPAIEDSGPSGLKAVRSHAKRLKEMYLADAEVAPVHGQLKRPTRERIMHRFRQGKIDVLIATTVIEVGVDVPNASLMVVEHAERFGLAQLHQMRGRVGRGSRKSLCVFIADPTTDDGRQRMDAIAKTADGFAIAEADLGIRGIGEMLGTRQSGLPPLRIADLSRHLDLLKLARRDAAALADADPKLTAPAHDLLRKRLIKQYGPAIGLADVG